MNALDGVFPDDPFMVYRWYVNRNAKSKAKKNLDHVGVFHPTPGPYANWGAFVSTYNEITSEATKTFKSLREAGIPIKARHLSVAHQ